MIEWFAWVQGVVAALAALVAIGFAIRGKTPNDYTLGAALLVGAFLIAQIIISIVAPSMGNEPTGSLLEYWMYLITAAIMVPAAMLWALVERTVMANVVLGFLGASIAVMMARMHQIWFINSA
ncbi:MAG: hypothetical protein QNL53_03235 [Microbacteriaceae bacterium]